MNRETFAGMTDDDLRPWVRVARLAAKQTAAACGQPGRSDEFFAYALVGVCRALTTPAPGCSLATLVDRRCRYEILDTLRVMDGTRRVRTAATFTVDFRRRRGDDLIAQRPSRDRVREPVAPADADPTELDDLRARWRRVRAKLRAADREFLDLLMSGLSLKEIGRRVGRCESMMRYRRAAAMRRAAEVVRASDELSV